MIQCTRCKQSKETESFVKDAGRKTGRFAWCKDCVRAVVEERHKNYIPSDDSQTMRECNRCLVPYPLTQEYFNINRSRKYGFEYECKLCKRARRSRAYKENPKKEHAWAAKRRVTRKNNGPSETIQYDVVFERDGGICLLCDLPIEADKRYPHPQSGTIDHIKPVSKGGLHLYVNVQLAHARCNWSKGDRYQNVT